MDFDSMMLKSHRYPIRLETQFLICKVGKRIIWVDVIVFKFFDDNQHKEIH